MYNDENFVTLCLSLQLNFILKAYVRCEFIIHSGVSGDTTMCLFLSHEKLPHSSMKSSYINTHTIIQYVNACACTQRHTEENSTSGDKKFFEQTPFFSLQKWKGKESCQCFLQSSLAGFPIICSIKGCSCLPCKVLQQNHCMFMGSLLARVEHLKPLGMNS